MAKLITLEQTDVLTDVLGTLRPRGRVFCVSEFSAPWSMSLARSPYAHFHVIERGAAWIRVQGESQAVALTSGDLVIVPHGRGHTLSNGPRTRPLPLKDLVKSGSGGCNVIRHGGGGAQTLMTCGSFQFEAAAGNPLLELLPAVIHIHGGHGQMAEWLEPTLRLLAHEARTPRPGSEMIITRLIDVIMVQAIRAWLAQQPFPAEGQAKQNGIGWLGALRDKQIGAALGLLHRQPHQRWSIEQLARQVGMSRSPFAAKFTRLVGEPPLTYLTRWRMHLAATLLRDEGESVGKVAGQVGYESEAAFTKAFKRAHGVAPVNWRRQRVAEKRKAA